MEFGFNDTILEYFMKLVDRFIRLPPNKKELSLAEKNEFNPV